MTNNIQNQQSQSGGTAIINKLLKKSNGIGKAGFILAIIALFLGQMPVIGWIIWVLGLIFSIIGIFKVPRGLAIAGLVISLIGAFLLLVVFASIREVLNLFN